MDGRIEAGFRHRLHALLAGWPDEERRVEVSRLLAAARAEAGRDPLAPARLLVEACERLRSERTLPSPERLADPRFLCDRSLGGLARWLRAAGYEAWLSPGTPPHRLPDEALRRGLALITTDAEALERRIVADGSLRVVWLPSALTIEEKLALVLRDLGLPLGDPRCMACGGPLVARAREDVLMRVPPRTARWKDEYFVCAVCDRLYWRGTHWARISAALRTAVG